MLGSLGLPVYADSYQEGFEALEAEKYDEAFDIWFPLAKAGDAEAMRGLGLLFYYGTGVKKNLESAFEWRQKAAEQGNSEAMLEAANMLLRGQGSEKQPQKAADYLASAAEQGNVAAKYNLAQLYLAGHGVSKNASEARRLLEEAAAMGHEKATARLAKLTAATSGPMEEPKEQMSATTTEAQTAADIALRTETSTQAEAEGYMSSASQSQTAMADANAQPAVEVAAAPKPDANALHVPKRNPVLDRAQDAYALGQYTRAAQIWSKAADTGEPEAYFWLGRLYNRGEGFEISLSNAYGLYRYAAEHNYAPAGTALANIQQRMTPDELYRGERVMEALIKRTYKRNRTSQR